MFMSKNYKFILILAVLLISGLIFTISPTSSEVYAPQDALSPIPNGLEYAQSMSATFAGRGWMLLVGSAQIDSLDSIEAYLFDIRNEDDILLTVNIDAHDGDFNREEIAAMFESVHLPLLVYAYEGQIIGIFDSFDDYNIEIL